MEQKPRPQIFRYVTKDKVLDVGDLLDPDPKRSKVRFILLQFGQDFKATTRALHYAAGSHDILSRCRKLR